MALTATIHRRVRRDKFIDIIGTLAWDSSYPSGGESYETPLGTKVLALKVHPYGGYTFAPDYSNKKILAYQMSPATGRIINYAPGGGDLKGGRNPAATEATADQAAAAVNSVLLKALDTFTNLAGTATPTAQPDVPRNVVLTVANDSGGSLALFEGTSVYTITGVFRGAAQVETLNWTSSAGNKTIATAKFRTLAGVKPFDSVTTVTWTNAPAGGLKLSLGVGAAMGYPENSLSGVDGDFIKTTVSGANYATASLIDHTNKTIMVAASGADTADGFDLATQYKGVLGPMSEVANTTSLAALTAAPFEATLFN